MTSTGEPFHFLPTAPDVLFCKGSPPMKKVINDCSARLTPVGFQAKTNFCKCCPPSLDQEKEDDHEMSDQETSTSFPKSIRVQHQPRNSSYKNFSLFHTYVPWLTVILFPRRSWRHPQCRKPGTTWDGCNSWCTDGCKWGTNRYSRCSRRQHKL